MLEKKAQFSIFSYMIIVFLALIFFGALVWVMGMINDVFHDVGVANDINPNRPLYVNMTVASDNIFGQLNQSIQALRMVSLVYILGLAVVIILTNVLQTKHPIWFFAYLLIALLAVIFAPLISNAYETLLDAQIMDGTLNTFSASNFLVLNLPTLVLIISTIGAVFLFINLIRTDSGGEIAI
jgi:uncharacterized membrane protein